MKNKEQLKTQINELKHEIERLEGKRGVCNQCSEEGFYANWGQNKEPKICLKCWNKNEVAKARKKYLYLIGLKIEDVIIDSSYYPLRGFKLEGGIVIEAESDYDGDSKLVVIK